MASTSGRKLYMTDIPLSSWRKNRHTPRDPLTIGLERQPQSVIGDPQVAVAPTANRRRHHGLHLLRDHTDVLLLSSVVRVSVVAKPIGQVSEEDDVVLQSHVRTAPSSTTAPSAPSTP